jgi:hypothetical protein
MSFYGEFSNTQWMKIKLPVTEAVSAAQRCQCIKKRLRTKVQKRLARLEFYRAAAVLLQCGIVPYACRDILLLSKVPLPPTEYEQIRRIEAVQAALKSNGHCR